MPQKKILLKYYMSLSRPGYVFPSLPFMESVTHAALAASVDPFDFDSYWRYLIFADDIWQGIEFPRIWREQIKSNYGEGFMNL